MNIIKLSSCLSPDVAKLITETGISNRNAKILANDDFIICWEDFGAYFESYPQLKCVSGDPMDQNTYMLLIEHIAPILNSVKGVYDALNESDVIKLKQQLQWSRFDKTFGYCWELLNSHSKPINTTLATLIATTYIERSLGNLYLSKGKTVPFLIKDLINSKELEEIIGPYPVLALKIVMGSPLSLNLRNVIWHGFASPEEIDKRYCYFLLAIVSSLSWETKMNKNLNYRKQIAFNPECFTSISPSGNEVNYSVLYDIFQSSPLIYEQMLPYWTESLTLFKTEKYGESLFLSLPALENVCRILYGTLNKCPENILTAENTKLYLTFDEMLAEHLQSGEPNELRNFLGDNILEMLLDLLMYEEGPRVRDRVSHGEVLLEDIPRELSLHVLHIGAVICCKASSPSIKENFSYIQQILSAASEYQAKSHPISKLKQRILEIVRTTDVISKIPELNGQFQKIDLSCTCSCIGTSNSTIFRSTSYEDLAENLERATIVSLYSSHQELLLIKVARQIASNVSDVANSIRNSLVNRCQLVKQGKLRSRQRLNYKRLLQSCSIILQGIENVLFVILYLLFNIRTISQIEGDIEKKLMKFLKKILQCVENLVTSTDINHNQWEKTSQISEFVVKHIEEFKNTWLRCISFSKPGK